MFRQRIQTLYESERFRMGLVVFDCLTVISFVVLTFLPPSPHLMMADMIVGGLMLAEFTGWMAIAHRPLLFLIRPSSILDLAIIASLLVPPLMGSFAFLRVLRALRLLRALRILKEVKRRNRWTAEHGELISSATNLIVFIFVTSSVVYELQVGHNPAVKTFIDALYFTVTTLTTTGFGDITLVGDTGRILSVIIMIVGISLFVKLAQAIVRPSKVHFECPACGLSRHEPDAVHCKHCGSIIHIEKEDMV